MFKDARHSHKTSWEELCLTGYAPAVAATHLREGRYSKAVEICREQLERETDLLSVRLILARALYHAGQTDSAAEQFYHVLSVDPDNLVALKYLADIKFANSDEMTALAGYRRVLEIDPDCHALYSPLSPKARETTRTITIKRPLEAADKVPSRAPLRKIYFYTETMGDLFLAQGHSRLAAEVYRSLGQSAPNLRLDEKLARADRKAQDKEAQYVKKTD